MKVKAPWSIIGIAADPRNDITKDEEVSTSISGTWANGTIQVKVENNFGTVALLTFDSEKEAKEDGWL